MKKQFLCLLGFIAGFSARAAIAYFDGPAFTVALEFPQIETLDLDRSGSTDFTFSCGGAHFSGFDSEISTFISPASGNAVVGTNYPDSIFVAGAIILSSGATIGPDAAWCTNDPDLANYGVGSPSGPLNGPLGSAGSGFLGVRFQAADGTHYGWIRAASTNNAGNPQSGPIILDWAYETQTNTAILAGAIPVVPIDAPAIVSGSLLLQWSSQPGLSYQVQFEPSLNALAWANFDLAIPATTTNSMLAIPLTNSTAFFRVLQSN